MYHADHIKDLYLKADPHYGGRYALRRFHPIYISSDPQATRFTVPMLWDKKQHKIVNNESSEIIRIFNKAFNEFIPDKEKAALDLYPDELAAEIDELNDWVYDTVNSTCVTDTAVTSH